MPDPPSKILVVDDQPETGLLMTRVLKHLGHDAVHVHSGKAALHYMSDHLPDAVLLDYMMPEMDGLAVLRALRADPRTRALPVILFSANNDPKVVQSAMKQGASEYWVKATIAVEEMGVRLSRWLGGSSAPLC
jgi:CheY-like chemotaxis protein